MNDEILQEDVLVELPVDQKVAVKLPVITYPHYIPMKVRRDREKQLLERKPRDDLRNDIQKLTSGINLIN